MRSVVSKAQPAVSPRLKTISLAILVACLALVASRVLAEDLPALQRDASGEKIVHRSQDRNGFIPPEFSRDHVSDAVGASRSPDKVLPTAYDARFPNYVSPVKNQGSCGACYAFGTAADMESRLMVDGHGVFDLSENNIKECNYQDASCAGGNQYMTISYLTRNGVVLETCDPYVAANMACNSSCAVQFTVLEWLELSGNTVPPTDDLKQHILDYGPVHTTVYAGNGDAWQTTFNNYNGTGALYYTGNETPNHSVFLVGWDDEIAHAGGTGAWIVKNSWGTSWGGDCGFGGSNGYFYIAYGSASIGKYSSVIKEYMVTDERFSVLGNDEGGFNSALGTGSPTLYGLASVTAAEDTYLHRVEFWTTDTTTDVDVFVYGNFNGSTASNVLASKYDQSFAEPGYHYVQLDEPLALSAGQTVYLAVKFGNQSYTYPLAVDGDGPVDSGKSYYSLNGSTWASAAGSGADVTIRARVSTDTELSVMDPGESPPPSPLPADLRLEMAYPNPFNPTTTIEYSLHQPGEVALNVYDLKGALIRHLVKESQPAGTHDVLWDGRNDAGSLVPSGVYFCRAEQGPLASSLKLVLLK